MTITESKFPCGVIAGICDNCKKPYRIFISFTSLRIYPTNLLLTQDFMFSCGYCHNRLPSTEEKVITDMFMWIEQEVCIDDKDTPDSKHFFNVLKYRKLKEVKFIHKDKGYSWRFR